MTWEPVAEDCKETKDKTQPCQCLTQSTWMSLPAALSFTYGRASLHTSWLAPAPKQQRDCAVPGTFLKSWQYQKILEAKGLLSETVLNWLLISVLSDSPFIAGCSWMEINHKGSTFLFIINFYLVLYRLVRPCSNLLNLSHIVNSFSKFIHSRSLFLLLLTSLTKLIHFIMSWIMWYCLD